VKTKIYNAVKDDNLSPTLFAYYNCDKSRQILSDREAAAIKSMKFDNDFENLVEDNFLFNPNKNKKEKEANKDFDIVIFFKKFNLILVDSFSRQRNY